MNLVLSVVIILKESGTRSLFFTYMCIYTYTYIHVYIHMYTYTHIYKYIYIFVFFFLEKQFAVLVKYNHSFCSDGAGVELVSSVGFVGSAGAGAAAAAASSF